jgi:hypothetical protein
VVPQATTSNQRFDRNLAGTWSDRQQRSAHSVIPVRGLTPARAPIRETHRALFVSSQKFSVRFASLSRKSLSRFDSSRSKKPYSPFAPLVGSRFAPYVSGAVAFGGVMENKCNLLGLPRT